MSRDSIGDQVDHLGDDLIWGVDGENGIAAFLNIPPAKAYYLISQNQNSGSSAWSSNDHCLAHGIAPRVCVIVLVTNKNPGLTAGAFCFPTGDWRHRIGLSLPRDTFRALQPQKGQHMLHIPIAFDNATQPAVKTVTGRYLAHNRRDPRGRASLAADIIAGRKKIDPATLTVAQVTKLCRANKVYVLDARDPERRNRLRQLKLQKAWEAVDPDHRTEFCRCVGLENVWQVLAAAVG